MQLPYNNTEMLGKYCQVWMLTFATMGWRTGRQKLARCGAPQLLLQKGSHDRRKGRWKSGFTTPLWLLSAVSEVKRAATEYKSEQEILKKKKKKKKERGRKIIVGRGAGYTVVQLYLIKSTAVLMWAQGISPNILQSWNGQRAPCDAPTEDFRF